MATNSLKLLQEQADGSFNEVDLAASASSLLAFGSDSKPTTVLQSAYQPSGGASAPVVLTYGATISPDTADGLFRKTTLTGDATIEAPLNATEGMKWEWWVTSDGTPRVLTLDAAILIPSDSAFTSPKTLTISKTYVILMKHNGTAWMLASVVGGF